MKTSLPSSPHSSRPQTPKADDCGMDTSISPIPMHRGGAGGVASLQREHAAAAAAHHRRSLSGGGIGNMPVSSSTSSRVGGRIRPKLLLTQSNNNSKKSLVHHPHVTHRSASSHNKENKENFAPLPPWKTALDSTLPDDALVNVTPNAKAALARLTSPKQNSFSVASGNQQRVTDTLRSELGLTSPQKHAMKMKRASMSSAGSSSGGGLTIAQLSRHNASHRASSKQRDSSRVPLPLRVQDLDSTLVEDENDVNDLETPLFSSREASQSRRLTANKVHFVYDCAFTGFGI